MTRPRWKPKKENTNSTAENATQKISDQIGLNNRSGHTSENTCDICNESPCPQWCIAEIDRRLVAAGWDPITPFWWNVIRESRGYKNIVIRGGRRGKKSTHVCIIAVSEALNPKHKEPPGDIAYFGIVSAVKDQAVDRIRTCAKILDVLQVPHKALTERITLSERNIGIRAFVATLKGVVSFTAIGLLCDEMARWQDPDNGANPAREVMGSLKPTMATMKQSQAWYVSSPWSTLDLHHEMFERGDTRSQKVFYGPTWEINPSLTEQETHDLEEDEATWEREYKAIPMSSDETKFFSGAFIDACASGGFTGAVEKTSAGADFAFRRNSSAMVVLDKSGERLKVTAAEERAPGLKPLVPSETIHELIGIAAEHAADSIACDLHYIESVREDTELIDMPLLEFPTASTEIMKAYVRVRVLISKGWIDLSSAPKLLLQQLKETSEKPTENSISIKQKNKGKKHGDMVSAFVCAVWAIDQLLMSNNPWAGKRRFELNRNAKQSNSLGKLTMLPTPDLLD